MLGVTDVVFRMMSHGAGRRRRRVVLALVAAVAVALYAAMWFGWVQNWPWVVTVDAAALDAAHRIGVEHPGWVTFWNVLCTVFSPVAFRVLTLGLIAWALVRRRTRVAAFLFVSVEGTALLTEVAKRLADRPRPDTALVVAPSTSFPSGHAVGTMVAVLALAVVAAPYVHHGVRVWAAAGVLVVLAVGVGRVALNVHHPSDVLAGWALGYVYFLACLPILRPPVTARDETPGAPGTAPRSARR